MFTAYFDAAGAVARGGVMSIAGFVSDVRKWKRFEIEWKGILDRETVRCFHMTEFVSKKGEFKDWAGQSERSGKFIADLIACTRRNINKAFGGAIVLADYEAINRKYKLREFGGYPYSLCGHYCVELLQKWRRKNGNPSVVVMFENGDLHRGDLMRLCESEGVAPLFPSKEEAVPCQAADLFAWRTRDAFEAALGPGLTFEKVALLKERFGQVWGNNRHEAFYGDLPRLERFCIDRQIPKRSRQL